MQSVSSSTTAQAESNPPENQPESPQEALQDEIKARARNDRLLGLAMVGQADSSLDLELAEIKKDFQTTHRVLWGEDAAKQPETEGEEMKVLVGGDLNLTRQQEPKPEATPKPTSNTSTLAKAAVAAALLGTGGGAALGGMALIDALKGERPVASDTDTYKEFDLEPGEVTPIP